jgi:hypothetical protein
MKRVTITCLRETHWDEKQLLHLKHLTERVRLSRRQRLADIRRDEENERFYQSQKKCIDELRLKQNTEKKDLLKRHRAEIEINRKQLPGKRRRPAPEPKHGPENVVSFRQHRKRRQQGKKETPHS